MKLEQLQETIEVPKAVRDFQPEWGIVLGSGLANVVEEVDAILHLPYEEVRGIPTSRVPGHHGRFIFGQLAGQRVIVAQGRAHLYEGYSSEEVTAAVRFMSILGAEKLVLTNAAGSLNPAFAPGSWMILSDHLNLTGTSPLLGTHDFVDMTGAYSAKMRERFHQVAAWTSIQLHEGVYAGVLGPQYETPAEVRMLRTLGADAVGMSTVLEAIQARALGMEVVGLSCLTNWGAGMRQDTILEHDDVLETGRRAAGQLAALLTRALQEE